MTLEIVADTNILFSALIKSGKIRRLILTRGILKVHIPEELAQELHNHTERLRKYLNLKTTEIHKLIDEFINEVATMATKKVIIEVEVPEDLSIGKDRLEGIARAILFEVAAQDISKLVKPSEEEIRKVIEEIRRGLRSPHQ